MKKINNEVGGGVEQKAQFVEGLVNNLARGWGICESVVRDKHENVCNLFSSRKHNSLKIILVPFWACLLISEVQAMVRLYDHQGPFTSCSVCLF